MNSIALTDRSFTRYVRLAAAIVFSCACSVAVGEESSLPNIVLIVADDMGYGDVGCYNLQSKIPTPNMDRLAREGIRFTDAHSADSVCTPSRYAMMTGRYCWRTQLKRGVLFNYEPPLIEKGRMTVASLLRQNGYTTGMVGKWHLGLGFTARQGKQVDFDRPLPWPGKPNPDRQISESVDFSVPVFGGPNDLGFDYAFYTAGCSTDQEPFCFIENRVFLDMTNATYRHPRGSWRSGMAASKWINETVDVSFTDKAVNFITRSHQKIPNKPFFLYLPLSAPHSPHLVPDFARGKSRAGVRGDMVWLFDSCVGRIVKILDELNLTDNTLLIVTSDNGPLKGSLKPGAPEGTAKISNGHKSVGELRGYKGRIFEGGHRIPFIAKWPKRIPVASISDQPLCLIDLLATCAAIVDAKLPNTAGEDSVNMLLAVRGMKKKEPIRESIVHSSGHGVFSVRNGKWKIIFGGVKGQLYDLKVDPYETTDVVDKHPEVVEELTRLMEKYKNEGRSAPLR
ncbi:MAG: arylsulfatase A [Verrucomicrobiales bacterium]|jgi:arylsulfatase A